LATTCSFSIEIVLGTDGIRSVRVLGKDWNQSAHAHALLQRLSPLIEKLDAAAKTDCETDGMDDSGLIQ
jgi:hypothetical protein